MLWNAAYKQAHSGVCVCVCVYVCVWSRALAALPEDLGSFPHTHKAAHDCLKLQFRGIRCPLCLLSEPGMYMVYHLDASKHLHT